MIKISLDLKIQQIEKMIDRLPVTQKLRLLRNLERKTLRRRWSGILSDIDRRLKRFPVSSEDIAEEIKACRENHA